MLVQFVGIKTPYSPLADDIFTCVLDVLRETLGVDAETIKEKLVGFGCDGASVMIGKYKGRSKHVIFRVVIFLYFL